MSNQGYLDQPDLHVRAPWRSALLTFPGNLKGALKAAHEDPSKTMFGVGQGIPSPFVTKVPLPNLLGDTMQLLTTWLGDCLHKARLYLA